MKKKKILKALISFIVFMGIWYAAVYIAREVLPVESAAFLMMWGWASVSFALWINDILQGR